LKRASAKAPTIVAVDMDRPAILTNVRSKARALIAVFGASDAALLDVVSGRARAEGRLPFELPSSMENVEAQDPAKADDTASPLYPLGLARREDALNRRAAGEEPRGLVLAARRLRASSEVDHTTVSIERPRRLRLNPADFRL